MAKKRLKRVASNKPVDAADFKVRSSLHMDPKARKCVDAIKKCIMDGRKPNIKRCMLDAGYTDTQARANTIKRSALYKAEIPQFLIDLMTEREKAIKDLPKKRPKAKYRDLIDGIEKATKVVRLEVGLSTDRVTVTLSDEERADLDKLLE